MSAIPDGYSEADVERWMPEPPKIAQRTHFERDRARIVHSSALRRLGAKTQILGLGSGDFVRTRLTHSLEVAQVGRELGKALGCSPDIVDAACLAHDLGHPPFGHNGERALDQVTRHIGGFEGNAQTLRLLTRLEPKSFNADTGRSVGLNLTRASLDATVKYPWREPAAPARPDGKPSRKFGVYEDDLPVFEWLRTGTEGTRPSFEAQVMDVADDISYSVHDLEDSIVYRVVKLSILRDTGRAREIIDHVREWYGYGDEEALLGALERLQTFEWWADDYDGSRQSLAKLKDMTSQLIGRFAQAIYAATRAEYGIGDLTRHRASLVVPQDTQDEILLLKGIAVHFLMAPRETSPTYKKQRLVLRELVKAVAERGEEAMEPQFAADYRAASGDDERLRVAVDQVASLTDTSAYNWHHKYCISA